MEEMTLDMNDVARKTKSESVSMTVITLVTLFFLPGTFISVCQSSSHFLCLAALYRARSTFILTWRLDPNEYGYFPQPTELPKSIQDFGTHFSLFCDDNPVDGPRSLNLASIPSLGDAQGKSRENEIFELQMAGLSQS